MPRTGRAAVRGICCHVLNRGNGRAEVFHTQEDYAAFMDLLRQAGERVAVRLLAWCVMREHLHLVLWPRGDDDLGRYVQSLSTSHVRRCHRHDGGSGRVWQGRYQDNLTCVACLHLLVAARHHGACPRGALIDG
jgi:putative transposase